MSKGHPGECPAGHGTFRYEKEMKRGGELKPVSERRAAAQPRRRSTLKQGKGFAASKAQQDKVKELACLNCGRDRHEARIDPAHVYPRRLATCPCADGVVPLCSDCHRLYDDQNESLDLLPALLAHGYRAELVHAIVVHEVSPFHLLEQVTGTKWIPASESPVREGAS